jgi:hypothetical protein
VSGSTHYWAGFPVRDIGFNHTSTHREKSAGSQHDPPLLPHMLLVALCGNFGTKQNIGIFVSRRNRNGQNILNKPHVNPHQGNSPHHIIIYHESHRNFPHAVPTSALVQVEGAEGWTMVLVLENNP